MGKGEFTITLEPENKIVHVVAHDELSKELGEEIITKASMTAAGHQYNIFCDVRQAEVKVPFADWFFLPRRLAIFRNGKIRAIKVAVLISPGKHEKIYGFYEKVTHNLGMNLRGFLQEKEALEWLKQS